MKKLFSIMLGRCFALAFLLFFSGKSFAENDNYTRAADTFKAIEKLYGVEDVPLFRETYPFDNHLKVSYLSNQEQAEQQKLYSYLWPFSGSLSAVTALLEVKPKSDFRKVLTKTVRPGLEMYLDTRRTPTAYASYINTAPVSDRFYDDNIWIGLDFTDLYLLTGKKEYLSQAKMVWRFIESGTDDKLGYGIYWCEQKKNGKNTCSNAPGSVYASKLFLATGDSSYLQAGIRLYEWTKENLQDPADGLYFDNKSLNGEIGRAKFAYNSGQMMQSAALLYRITGEKKYLQDAQRLAAACYNRFFSHDFQSGRNAVLSIFTVFPILTVFSVFPVAAFGFYLVAETVCQPFAVQCPVPDAAGAPTDTDCRRQSLVAFVSFLSFLTFLSMIYGDRGVVEKTECVADDGGALDNRNDIGYAVVVLQYIDNGL